MTIRSVAQLFGGVLIMSLVIGNMAQLRPASAQTIDSNKVVVAHRGASGYLPEHTLPAAAMAHAMGTDFQEQDIVVTKDDQLVVWHDLTLDRNTDVGQRFPNRARDDGHYYVVDFTLEELRQLRVTESFRLDEQGNEVMTFPERFPLWQSSFRISTFAEQIELIQGLNKSTGRKVGLYPELKSPAFHQQNGKDISRAVLEMLKQYGYTSLDADVYVQTFEFEELKRVKTRLFPELGMELKLVQLMAGTSDYDWMLQADGMHTLAQYANGIGPDKNMIITPNSSRDQLMISSLVKHAHQAGLTVHPYTFRADSGQVPEYADSFEHLLELFLFQANVDGVFTDFPDRAVNFLRDR